MTRFMTLASNSYRHRYSSNPIFKFLEGHGRKLKEHLMRCYETRALVLPLSQGTGTLSRPLNLSGLALSPVGLVGLLKGLTLHCCLCSLLPWTRTLREIWSPRLFKVIPPVLISPGTKSRETSIYVSASAPTWFTPCLDTVLSPEPLLFYWLKTA